jgi:hypothetical protein
MTIKEFVEAYKAKRFVMIKNNPEEISEYLKKELEIKTYIPFNTKRQVAEMIVKQNITEIDGVKKYDSIDGYMSFIMASITVHTNLEPSKNPIADYDLLAESGLLTKIIAQFQNSHDEIDIILKMALAMELEDNNVNVLVGHFLNEVSGTLDVLKEKLEKFDPQAFFGADIKKEDLAKFSSFLNKLK